MGGLVIGALNGYFECLAGAVLAHDGEVLKFIGDGLLALTGGGAPAHLWHDFMLTAHSGLPARPLPGLNRETAPTPPATAGQPGFWGKLFGTASGQSG